jgi:hypothetical protein
VVVVFAVVINVVVVDFICQFSWAVLVVVVIIVDVIVAVNIVVVEVVCQLSWEGTCCSCKCCS